MGEATVRLGVGSSVLLDGQAWTVEAFEGSRVLLGDGSDFRSVRLMHLVEHGSVCADSSDADRPLPEAAGPLLDALDPAARAEVATRAGHVREVLTGYRSGSPARSTAGEPMAEYAPTVPLMGRYRAKAAEIGVAERTIRRWAKAYLAGGEAELARGLAASSRPSSVDRRWDAAAREVLDGLVEASTPGRDAVIVRVASRLEQVHGVGVVPLPSAATAYRRLAVLGRGRNAFTGSAKGRRSIAERPPGVYGRLRATRPGEYVVLDTTPLDVFAMEPLTLRWVPVELTVAMDLASRCVVGLRLTPVSTKSVDVAGVLFEAMLPQELDPQWADGARWPYHGVPEHVVFSEEDVAPGGPGSLPVCAPETIVVDHGKVYVSAHVLSVCARFGVSVQPAKPRKPTDKPALERFFRTLRTGLLQYLPAYKGPDVFSRGLDVEGEAFFFVHELEDVIREWVASVYHVRAHDGLVVPELPGVPISPARMFEIGLARAGVVRVPADPDAVFDFLDTRWRTIQHYGVEVDGLRYNGPVLRRYVGARSPYGGVHAGKWPIRVNARDVRHAWLQDPDDGSWHRLDWEHAAGLDAPFSRDAADYARRLAVRTDTDVDPAAALAELLGRWEAGMVTARRERTIALQVAATRPALPPPPTDGPGLVADLAGVRRVTGDPDLAVEAGEGVEVLSDDDVWAFLDEDRVLDRFEVLE